MKKWEGIDRIYDNNSYSPISKRICIPGLTLAERFGCMDFFNGYHIISFIQFFDFQYFHFNKSMVIDMILVPCIIAGFTYREGNG